MLLMTEIIRKRQFTLAKIYGDLGIGKTTYALKVLAEYYNDWHKALNSIVSLDEFIDIVEDAKDHHYIADPVLIDDATLELYYLDFSNKEVKKFIKILTIARLLIKAVVLTLPDNCLLIKKLRSFEGSYSVKIIKADGHNGRIAKIYKHYTLPDGRSYIKHIGNDFFTARMPDDIYKQYLKIRNSFLSRIDS